MKQVYAHLSLLEWHFRSGFMALMGGNGSEQHRRILAAV